MGVTGQIILSIICSLLAAEFFAWLPHIADMLLKLAVKHTPQELQERMKEEWQAHLDAIPGALWKFTAAAGFLITTVRISSPAWKHIATDLIAYAMNGSSAVVATLTSPRWIATGVIIIEAVSFIRPAPIISFAPRSISLYNANTGEWVRTVYWANGHYIRDAVQDLNWVLRDHRTDEVLPMNVAIIDVLGALQARSGKRDPLIVLRGYASSQLSDNASLRDETDAGKLISRPYARGVTVAVLCANECDRMVSTLRKMGIINVEKVSASDVSQICSTIGPNQELGDRSLP